MTTEEYIAKKQQIVFTHQNSLERINKSIGWGSSERASAIKTLILTAKGCLEDLEMEYKESNK